MTSIGINGKPELFQKPWFATLNMLFAMGLVGVVDKFVRMSSKQSEKEVPLMIDEAPVAGGNNGRTGELSYRMKVLIVSVPAAFDIAATALCAIGMLYIPASVWQMLRGSSIVFACLLSIIFLKRKMYAFNWLGLALCVAGVTLVGLANVYGSNSTSSSGDVGSMVFGMSLVIAGQVVQAAQVIAEEFLLKEVDLPSMVIIGLEGFWGVVIMALIVYPCLWVLPGEDGGHLEDPLDTLALLSNNPLLLLVVVGYLFSCGTFNATGIAVTQSLSGVHRSRPSARSGPPTRPSSSSASQCLCQGKRSTARFSGSRASSIPHRRQQQRPRRQPPPSTFARHCPVSFRQPAGLLTMAASASMPQCLI
eukprot:CAMPEP_0115516304 /NCGR_PEP_ID=MMETSP0271-20121206/76693_1 /TAXON_ID=71861 /ORGANISM="Scrippsiella trochoidea, Strain CCMP3099" /LENGTH=362 /DNA_ID=CAMNT_0002946963 /DNA_START=42 /DNA_END=1127 /DNA_ORIENTATION=+